MAESWEQRTTEHHFSGHRPLSDIPRPQIGNDIQLDPAVIDALPIAGTEVLSARRYGSSLWGMTAVVETQLPNHQQRTYFLKALARGELGYLMLNGEFESIKALRAVSPDFVPEIYALGKYAQPEPETYFILAQYREIGDQPPDPARFTELLADLHKRSVSPTGKFGFHMQTCHASIPQYVDWEDSWSTFYKKQQDHMFGVDEAQNGYWKGYSELWRLLVAKVVPHLLEPLQANGRTIKPCLVHGDLWDENSATDLNTRQPFIFDAGSFYAHNEYELGNWRQARHRLSDRSYIENYHRNFPISEPAAEWDDRNLLYAIHFDLVAAILFPEGPQRQSVKDGMTVLCKKYFPEDFENLEA